MKLKVKQAISLLLVFVLISVFCVGCTQSAESPQPVESLQPAGGEVLKIGFVNADAVDASAWAAAHYEGVEYLKKNVDGIEVVWVENVPDSGADGMAVIQQLVEEGCKMIFATSYYVELMKESAAKYPDISFYLCQGGTDVITDNLGIYDVRNYEAVFLTGYLAGCMSEGDVLGYVATQPMPTVLRALNGFALGVKYARPNAVVKTVFTNTWYDVTAEKEATNALMDAGATVIGMHTNTSAVSQTAQDRGGYCIGFTIDMKDFAPKAVLTSFLWKWGPIYQYIVEQYKAGKTHIDDVFWGMNEGCGAFTDLNADIVPADVKQKFEDVFAKLKAGEIQPFYGEVKDNKGNMHGTAGQPLSDEIIRSMDWLVDNVDGSY